MLTAEGNARSCNAIWECCGISSAVFSCDNQVYFLHVSFKYFACFKPLCIGSVYGDGDVEIKVPGSSLVKDTFFFSSSFSFFFFYYYFFITVIIKTTV